MQQFYLYILKCNDGSYYVGHTGNLDQRIAEHTTGSYSLYTSKRLPIEVVFVQMFPTRDEAFTMERQIKGWSRKKKEALIRNDWQELQKLARSKSD
jgi:predicted GIY-YIG superfamily endonuclease